MISKKVLWSTIVIIIVSGLFLIGIILREEHIELKEPEQNCKPLAGMTIATSGTSSFAIQSDNSLWAWGDNRHGQIGNGTTSKWENPELYPIPIKVMENAVAVSAGSTHVMVIRTDGSLWAWGRNNFGQLGDGTITIYDDNWEIIEDNNQNIPIKIIEDVIAVSAGSEHTTAITADGSLWAWGANHRGQLGNGTIAQWDEPELNPVRIMENVVYVSAAQDHTMAIRTDGSLWAWGANHRGQLGNGASTQWDEPNPIKVMENVIAVSAENWRTMAVTADGILWAWGSNMSHSLGDGTNIDRYNPTRIMTGIACISGSMAIDTNGGLWVWGSNSFGELGDGSTMTRYSPMRVTEDIVSVSGGSFHTMAIKDDGSLWTWGRNDYGQLGDGTVTIVSEIGVIEDNDQRRPIRIMDNLLLPIREKNILRNGEECVGEVSNVDIEFSNVSDAVTEGEEETTRPSSEPLYNLVREAYMEFLLQREFEYYIHYDYILSTEYAIIDIDGDGVPELIVSNSISHQISINLIFTYDLEQNSVIYISTQVGGNNLQYSQRYRAIVFSHHGGVVALEFVAKKNLMLNTIFILTIEQGSWSHYENGIERELYSDEFQNYVDELIEIELSLLEKLIEEY